MVIPCRMPDPMIPGTGADSPSMIAGEQLVPETPSNAQVKSELESTDESICIDDSIDESQWYAQGGADDLDETVKSEEGDAEDAAEDDAEYAAEDDAKMQLTQKMNRGACEGVIMQLVPATWRLLQLKTT